MFGMSFAEILIIIAVAVLVLGPEKLPNAIVEIAKFFKILKKAVNDAKSTFDQEMKIAELKADAQKYSEDLSKATNQVRKKLTFEELEQIKDQVKDISSDIDKFKQDISNPFANAKKENSSAFSGESSENLGVNSDDISPISKAKISSQNSKTQISPTFSDKDEKISQNSSISGENRGK